MLIVIHQSKPIASETSTLVMAAHAHCVLLTSGWTADDIASMKNHDDCRFELENWLQQAGSGPVSPRRSMSPQEGADSLQATGGFEPTVGQHEEQEAGRLMFTVYFAVASCCRP